jgi:hypothetical protein
MARDVAAEIRGATRRKFRAGHKIRIVLEHIISRLTTGKLVSAGRGRGVKSQGSQRAPYLVAAHARYYFLTHISVSPWSKFIFFQHKLKFWTLLELASPYLVHDFGRNFLQS